MEVRKTGSDRVLAAMAAILAFHLCVAATAQESKQGQDLGNHLSTSAGQTGAEAGKTGTVAAKPGEADGTGNPQLGGVRRPLYRLNLSDTLTLSFTLAPEFDQAVSIQPDGYVTLKDAPPVLAQGLTLAEFRIAVQRAYAGYLHDPQVAVALKDFDHPYFIAGGELGKPGKYELRSDTNILEAVEIAGGFTHEARHSQVLLFRHVSGDLVEARVFDLKKMIKGKNLTEAAQLRSGDLVFVPQNALSKIAQFLTRPSVSMYVNSTQF